MKQMELVFGLNFFNTHPHTCSSFFFCLVFSSIPTNHFRIIEFTHLNPPFFFYFSSRPQDVVTSLKEKLCLTAIQHFSLVLEHVKSLKRNKLTLLDYEQTLVKVNR